MRLAVNDVCISAGHVCSVVRRECLTKGSKGHVGTMFVRSCVHQPHAMRAMWRVQSGSKSWPQVPRQHLRAYLYIFEVFPSSSGNANSGDAVGYVTGIYTEYECSA